MYYIGQTKIQATYIPTTSAFSIRRNGTKSGLLQFSRMDIQILESSLESKREQSYLLAIFLENYFSNKEIRGRLNSLQIASMKHKLFHSTEFIAHLTLHFCHKKNLDKIQF